MQRPERNSYYDSFEEVEESLRDIDLDEQDRAYFPTEESKPPHY